VEAEDLAINMKGKVSDLYFKTTLNNCFSYENVARSFFLLRLVKRLRSIMIKTNKIR